MAYGKFTIGAIKRELREAAPHIAEQYSALWDCFVTDALTRIERRDRERMSDETFDAMHDYGMEQVRRLGLPSTQEAN